MLVLYYCLKNRLLGLSLHCRQNQFPVRIYASLKDTAARRIKLHTRITELYIHTYTMSNRYTHNKNEGSRGAFNPRKQQFVPKNPNSSAQKLSDSLRHSDSGAVASSATAGNRLTRKDGASVPNQTRSGNFVKYLPHDEAVASGSDWLLMWIGSY